MEEANEEADHKGWCDTELSTNEQTRKEKTAAVETLHAEIDELEASIAKLTEEIAELTEAVAALDAAMAEATGIRETEKANFAKTDKDLSESVEACGGALQALREYFEGAALLLQTGSQERASAKAKGATGIIQALEYAESDFQQQLADVRADESTAADKYEKLSQDSKLLKATKETEVGAKESEVKTLKSSLVNYNEDKEGTSTELDAVVAYLDELKPKCERKAPSYAERKAAREAEIDGLKEALKLLA